MKDGIRSGKVLGSYFHSINDQNILFTHSGLRPDFIKYLNLNYNLNQPHEYASYINGKLLERVNECGDSYKCQFNDEVFQAGRDRGGSGKSLGDDFDNQN